MTRFEWDPAKDRANQRKHGLSFSEASAMLANPGGHLEFPDDAHSLDEDRLLALGVIARGVVAVVFVRRA